MGWRSGRSGVGCQRSQSMVFAVQTQSFPRLGPALESYSRFKKSTHSSGLRSSAPAVIPTPASRTSAGLPRIRIRDAFQRSIAQKCVLFFARRRGGSGRE